MINVGFLTANHYPRLGGMEFATHFLVEGLNSIEDFNASVACATMPEIDKNYRYSYKCYRPKSFSYFTPYLFKRNQFKMVKKENIDLLHGPMIHGGGAWAMDLGAKMKIPFIAHSHGSDVQVVPQIEYGAQLERDKREIIAKVITNSDALIAVSSINKENIVSLGGQPDKIRIIPNGIHFKEISNVPYIDLRPQWKVDPEDFLLITVGRNRPIKRMELLFEALKKLKSYHTIKCLCVGPEENLGKLAEKYDVLNKVILTGRIPSKTSFGISPPYSELVNAYRAANLYISTSFVESFGNTSADALACGIPIVVGKNHGVRDVITEGQTGWVMKSETPEELAEMILSLYQQRQNLKDRAPIIRKSVAYLTWDYIAYQTAQLYKEVI